MAGSEIEDRLWAADERIREIIREHDRRLAARLREKRGMHSDFAQTLDPESAKGIAARTVTVAFGELADILEADE